MSEEKTPKAEEKKNTPAPAQKKPDPKAGDRQREKDYRRACKIAGWTRWSVYYVERAELFRRAAAKFQTLGNYKDSARRAEKCLAAAVKAETEGRDAAFQEAMELVKSAKTADDYFYAAEALERVLDHPDSEAERNACMEQYRRLKKRGGRRKVIVAALLCLAVVVGVVLAETEALQYGVANVYMAAGDYSNAAKWYRQAERFAGSEAKANECSYLLAGEQFDRGSYAKAYQTYRKLGNYRGAEDRAEESYRRMLEKAKPGDVVEFGQREDGKAAKWYVLENNGETVTLIAEFDLNHAFDSGKEPRTWADSELRTWLNTEFLSETFLRYERKRLVTAVLPSDPGEYGIDAGADTADQVYLLSAKEAKAYSDLLGAVDENGKAKEIYEARAFGWWLRTTGATEGGVATVAQTGWINYYGYKQTFTMPRVRPVVQVSIEPIL